MTNPILRVPLWVKLAGANALIVVLAIAAATAFSHPTASAGELMLVLCVALALGLAVNLTLVAIALRPIRELERTAWRIWHGDPAARVPGSPVSDPELDQVGSTLNSLLDHLDQDRARMHGLATEVIRAEDRERARIGRELHDSIAQSLAALIYQLSAAEREASSDACATRLAAIRVQAGEVLDEVDVLSHTVHPRVLNDLGLLAGLRHLARTVSNSNITVEVDVKRGTDDDFRGLGMETGSVLYRVAQEAVQNAARHSHADRVVIALDARPDAIEMTVADQGTGFDLEEARQRRPGMGLFTMAERVSLVRGDFSIDTAPGKGTTVRVSVPLEHVLRTPARNGRAAVASTHPSSHANNAR